MAKKKKSNRRQSHGWPRIDFSGTACAWVYVVSTNVAAVCWHQPIDTPRVKIAAGLGVLDVRFRSGAVYSYYDVPRAVYDAFLAAPSKGRFVWQSLRGRYWYERIDR